MFSRLKEEFFPSIKTLYYFGPFSHASEKALFLYVSLWNSDTAFFNARVNISIIIKNSRIIND